jgi:hypothetical protein
MPNTFELIVSSTVGAGGAASIDFTSIPSTYTDLCLDISIRDSQGGAANAALVSFNGSTSSFTVRHLQGQPSVSPNVNSATTPARFIGNSDSSGATASTFSSISLYIPNYAGSANKSYSADAATENNATEAYSNIVAGLWSNTAAINQVTISPSGGTFVQYSTAYLYGVKNA